MTERSRRILTVLTNSTYSIAREVVFEAEAVAIAEAVDKDEATKAASPIRKIVRTSRNAYQKKNISIAKTTTSASTMAVLVTLEVTVAHLTTQTLRPAKPERLGLPVS